MHSQNYQSGYGSSNQRLASCPPTALNGPMTGHMNMNNHMHNSNMINSPNGMNPSMGMNGPMTMNKSGMQQTGGIPGPQGAMYSGSPMVTGPRGRPSSYPSSQQQYLTPKRQFSNPGVQQYNAGPVMQQNYNTMSQSPYNTNQVRK